MCSKNKKYTAHFSRFRQKAKEALCCAVSCAEPNCASKSHTRQASEDHH